MKVVALLSALLLVSLVSIIFGGRDPDHADPDVGSNPDTDADICPELPVHICASKIDRNQSDADLEAAISAWFTPHSNLLPWQRWPTALVIADLVAKVKIGSNPAAQWRILQKMSESGHGDILKVVHGVAMRSNARFASMTAGLPLAAPEIPVLLVVQVQTCINAVNNFQQLVHEHVAVKFVKKLAVEAMGVYPTKVAPDQEQTRWPESVLEGDLRDPAVRLLFLQQIGVAIQLGTSLTGIDTDLLSGRVRDFLDGIADRIQTSPECVRAITCLRHFTRSGGVRDAVLSCLARFDEDPFYTNVVVKMQDPLQWVYAYPKAVAAAVVVHADVSTLRDVRKLQDFSRVGIACNVFHFVERVREYRDAERLVQVIPFMECSSESNELVKMAASGKLASSESADHDVLPDNGSFFARLREQASHVLARLPDLTWPARLSSPQSRSSDCGLQ